MKSWVAQIKAEEICDPEVPLSGKHSLTGRLNCEGKPLISPAFDQTPQRLSPALFVFSVSDNIISLK